MISYRRGRIQILDRGKLEAATCECYGSIQHLIDYTFPMGSREEQQLAAPNNRENDEGTPLATATIAAARSFCLSISAIIGA
jgi:hypothetical protein